MDQLTLAALSDWLTAERVDTAIALGLNVLYAIVIFIAALFVAGWLRRRVVALGKAHASLDPTLFGFLGSLARYAVLAFAVLFVLGRFGIQTTSLVALIGAAGLAIGLALQGTLSNLAAGVMIILFRPFKVGDFIEAAGKTGGVQEISLFTTELRTYDGLQIILPNADVWSSAILNYSANSTRMIDLTIGVSYASDLKKAGEVLRRVAGSDMRVLSEPAPFVQVKELGGSSVDFAFRVWTARTDWWATKCDLTEAIKLELDAAGIDIPFPTQTLHVQQG